MNQFELIQKEEVSYLKFPQSDVLKKADDIKMRYADIQRALALGNLEHGKIKIYFEDNYSKKVVETTIWGSTQEQVILKRGLTIPVNRIYKLS